jgi:hypothetical protein
MSILSSTIAGSGRSTTVPTLPNRFGFQLGYFTAQHSPLSVGEPGVILIFGDRLKPDGT